MTAASPHPGVDARAPVHDAWRYAPRLGYKVCYIID